MRGSSPEATRNVFPGVLPQKCIEGDIALDGLPSTAGALRGGPDNNVIYGGGGDRVYEGDGVETIITRWNGQRDYVSCGPGVDAMPGIEGSVDDYQADCEQVAY